MQIIRIFSLTKSFVRRSHLKWTSTVHVAEIFISEGNRKLNEVFVELSFGTLFLISLVSYLSLNAVALITQLVKSSDWVNVFMMKDDHEDDISNLHTLPLPIEPLKMYSFLLWGKCSVHCNNTLWNYVLNYSLLGYRNFNYKEVKIFYKISIFDEYSYQFP